MVKSGGRRKEVDFGSTELKMNVKSGLEKYVKLLLDSSLKVRTIVIMGSRARGDWKPHSDTDILVIAENFPQDHSGLLVALNPPEVWGLSLEPRAYTPKDFLDAIWALELTALDAIQEGIVLYDDGFWMEAKKAFQRAKRAYRLRRISDGWMALKPI
ncbi:MAG: nucleotidyltransferase domain-containing protein [Candidatus Bathyarchaeia archaeon]